jgi:DNA-binding NtrC family response regulator
MQQLFDLITRVAEDDISTVLIRGESGTGKEMVAKAIHTESKRRSKNFVPVNCAAIPDDLLESELFGYTKGAFTGATANKPGRIQYADQGTLFLDEIGDMKSALQAKLLRVIQEKEFEPVGAFQAVPVNTRILAATHCDLEKMVSEGRFREDLYYRLSVVPLHIPALKERPDDIPLLIDAFFGKYAENRGRERFTFSPQALAAINHYEWRGNVRELENLIQHMTILYSGRQVELTDLPEKFHDVVIPPESDAVDLDNSAIEQTASQTSGQANGQHVAWENGTIDFNELINDFETQLIVQALKLTEGNKKEAARLLNLKRTTLLEKIKKKDIVGDWDK